MYWGSSAQYSGTGFAKMFFHVKAVSPKAFASWASQTHLTASPMTVADYEKLLQHATMGQALYGSYPRDTFPTIASGFTLTGTGMYMTEHGPKGSIDYLPMAAQPSPGGAVTTLNSGQ
jgi:cytochrome o ubiquinol oxidase subunit 2